MAHTKDTLDSALERLFREHSEQLFISALAVTGCPERAEDAVQEAFYGLFRMKRSPRHLKAYVFRAVRNAALDQLEQKPRDGIKDSEPIFDSGGGPPDAAEKNEFKIKVIRAMKTLSDDERETVVSHLYADLTFRQIAKVREISINTVWSWYRRGMEKLRRQLGDES
ncbi:MAG: RNA polymerase sigma factor [Planctomycetota bacterium]|jgi:RNA polymerase sigma-70 factor (ECF subfamily)